MLTLFSRPAPVRSEVGLIVRNSLTIHTQQLVQTQYLSEHYVLTDVGRMLMLYWRECGQRYVVDRAKQELKPLDRQWLVVDHEHAKQPVTHRATPACRCGRCSRRRGRVH